MPPAILDGYEDGRKLAASLVRPMVGSRGRTTDPAAAGGAPIII